MNNSWRYDDYKDERDSLVAAAWAADEALRNAPKNARVAAWAARDNAWDALDAWDAIYEE